MKTLLLLSASAVHRSANVEIYRSLKEHIPHLTWCSGSAFQIHKTLPQGYVYLLQVDPRQPSKAQLGGEYKVGAFDLAIIDQSLDLTQDQSPSPFGGGIANRSLDFEGRDRPSAIAEALTRFGVICIGTSRNGVCLSELADDGGAVATNPLENLIDNLPSLMTDVARMKKDGCPGGSLKALTLRQPWAWSVFRAGKNMENRRWPTSIRGTVAIHVADTQPDGSFEASSETIRAMMRKSGGKVKRIPPYEKLAKGAIIGLVDIVDCVTQSGSPWFEGPLGFALSNPRLLKKPIPCAGKRRFFTVPDDVASQIAQMAGKI